MNHRLPSLINNYVNSKLVPICLLGHVHKYKLIKFYFKWYSENMLYRICKHIFKAYRLFLFSMHIYIYIFQCKIKSNSEWYNISQINNKMSSAIDICKTTMSKIERSRTTFGFRLARNRFRIVSCFIFTSMLIVLNFR